MNALLTIESYRQIAKSPDSQEPGEKLLNRGKRGDKGTRTPDPLHAMQVRYQLRHIPLFSSATLLGNKKIIHMPEARMQISTGSIRKTTREYCPPQGEKNEV